MKSESRQEYVHLSHAFWAPGIAIKIRQSVQHIESKISTFLGSQAFPYILDFGHLNSHKAYFGNVVQQTCRFLEWWFNKDFQRGALVQNKLVTNSLAYPLMVYTLYFYSIFCIQFQIYWCMKILLLDLHE